MQNLLCQKVFSQYRQNMKPCGPINGRKYTITHSDTTAELFVFIGNEYALELVTQMRDEVRLCFVSTANGLVLFGEVQIDGEGIIGDAKVRYEIFCREMDKALKALHIADRFLFEAYPRLNDVPVKIRFLSEQAAYNNTYDFGRIGNY